LLLPVVRRVLGRRASQNVVSWGDGEKPGLLVLVAHIDAGRGGLAARLHERRPAVGLGLLCLAQIAVFACCLLRALDVDGIALSAVQFVPTVVLIVAVALLLDVALSPTRGGENDNASGVALVLRLMQTAQPEHFEVCVLFTGAQKAMAGGMRSFLRRHRAELARERTVVLNLDEVGSGKPRFARKEGALLARRTHARLSELCEVIAEDDDRGVARALVDRSASDGYAALLRGLPAVTVTCRDGRYRAPGRVEEEAIEGAEAFCSELIARLDADVGPALAERVSSSG
jgi:hypothetical protein